MKSNINKMELLKEISAVEFMKEDLSLYLNTHPMDKEAIAKFNSYVMKCKELKNCYETNYGMLTAQNSMSSYPWSWINEPWPWENEANFQLVKEDM